VRKLHRR